MLRVLTNLNLLNRQDLTASAGLIASGYTGTWANIETDQLELSDADEFALGVIWTESYRDGTIGSWTPDVDGTGKLTIIWGKFRALTDQFTGTPAVGAALKVSAAGKLLTGTQYTDYIVAYCTKASHTIEHLGSSHTVIEFVTV